MPATSGDPAHGEPHSRTLRLCFASTCALAPDQDLCSTKCACVLDFSIVPQSLSLARLLLFAVLKRLLNHEVQTTVCLPETPCSCLLPPSQPRAPWCVISASSCASRVDLAKGACQPQDVPVQPGRFSTTPSVHVSSAYPGTACNVGVSSCLGCLSSARCYGGADGSAPAASQHARCNKSDQQASRSLLSTLHTCTLQRTRSPRSRGRC